MRAFRPATLEGYVLTFRRAASALVRGGHVSLKTMTGFAVFFEERNFVEALRPFLPKTEEQGTGYVHKMATQLIFVARHHLHLDAVRLGELEAVAARLKPKPAGMGRRNRERLEQFDDEAVVRRLLRFPEEERRGGSGSTTRTAARRASSARSRSRSCSRRACGRRT